MLAPIVGEEKILVANRDIHANANRIIQGLQSAYELLNHDEGAISKIERANTQLIKIETIGSDCTPEVLLKGSIQINPTDTITLVSSATTASQSICYNETDNSSNTIALPIEDVIYEIGGGAIGESLTVTYSANGGPSQINLPTGLGLSVTGTQVLISGSIVVSTTFTTPTVQYTYQIVTGGSCVSSTITGNFTVHSPPILVLTSGATTTNQVGAFAMCTNLESIADITYEFYGGATDVILEWTADTLTGVNGNVIPGTNQFVVSGIPSVNITSTTNYPFEVKTIQILFSSNHSKFIFFKFSFTVATTMSKKSVLSLGSIV